MTRIASIANNRLTLTDDLCGHSGLLPVTVAIEVFGKTETVDHITKRARCFRFKLKGQNILQIVHVWQG